MRITIMGTGGVGGYFGGRLAQGGCDVGFVARGAHLAALRENGLRVESQLGEIHLSNIRVSDDPVALGAADYIVVCVKLWDTEAAVRAVAQIVGPETAVISFQNGVQKDELLRRLLARGLWWAERAISDRRSSARA
jgi:2-dehydropantoate 2-reductase